jgi:hypothetical protein
VQNHCVFDVVLSECEFVYIYQASIDEMSDHFNVFRWGFIDCVFSFAICIRAFMFARYCSMFILY